MTMAKQLAFLIVSLFQLSSTALAYQTSDHDRFVVDGADVICPAGTGTPFCAELKKYLPFLRHGAVMEDKAYKGLRETFNGVEFSDEETALAYGPCKMYAVAGKTYAFCNHYFFVDSFLAGGGEGPCGTSILGATKPECTGASPHQWDSTSQRAKRLWLDKVLPYYQKGTPEAKARAYYWLGRVAHLLADSSVPAHVIPHDIGYIEFEHRVYEDEAGHVETGPLPDEEVPVAMDELFIKLARSSNKTHDTVRADACRREPRQPGCEAGRASPSRPLEGTVLANVKLTNDIINGKEDALAKPEIRKERELARLQLAQIKPRTVAYTARLLQLFRGEAAVSEYRIPLLLPELPLLSGFSGADFDGSAK